MDSSFIGLQGLATADAMGLFDKVKATVECSECGLEVPREIQFKHPGHRMETYEVGDFVQGVPAGRPLLRTRFTCPGFEATDAGASDQGESDGEATKQAVGEAGTGERGEHRVACWIHFDRGFLTDVTAHKPERPAQREPWMVEQAGWNAQELARKVRGLGALVQHRRETIEAEREGELPPDGEAEPLLEMHRLRSEAELLDRLESRLENVEERLWPRS